MDTQRKESADLAGRLATEGPLFNFFQALYLLEKRLAYAPHSSDVEWPFWRAGVRMRPSAALTLPATDIAEVKVEAERIHLILTFMGLYGVDAALPDYFTNLCDARTEAASALRAFLDVFNHRLYELLYLGWKKYRFYLQFEPDGRDRFSQYMLCLLGLGNPALQDQLTVPPARLIAYATLLGRQGGRCPERLARMLSDYFDGIPIQILEFMPRWVAIPNPISLGRTGAGPWPRLGRDTVIGKKVLDVSGKFRVVVGPINSLDDFVKFLPGGIWAEALCQLTRLYAPDQLEFDVELRLSRQALPARIWLGKRPSASVAPTNAATATQDPCEEAKEPSHARPIRLGWTTWLGHLSADVLTVVLPLGPLRSPYSGRPEA